jgi:purine-nucleoside phosphorylase
MTKSIQCIEMETYAFFCAAQAAGKQRTALLCISDAVNTDRGLLNRDAATRECYLHGREQILPEVLYRAVEHII